MTLDGVDLANFHRRIGRPGPGFARGRLPVVSGAVMDARSASVRNSLTDTIDCGAMWRRPAHIRQIEAEWQQRWRPAGIRTHVRAALAAALDAGSR
jgi:hypothetical protein